MDIVTLGEYPADAAGSFTRPGMGEAEFRRQYACDPVPHVEECACHGYEKTAFESGMDPGVGDSEGFTLFTYEGVPIYKTDNLEAEGRPNVVDSPGWRVVEDEGPETALAVRGP